MQFPPQRAKNQPNPAQDYTLLPTFSSSFHTLHFWVCLSLRISCSCNQLLLSLCPPFPFLPYFIDTTPLSSLCLCECSASSPAASREKQESKEEEKNTGKTVREWQNSEGEKNNSGLRRTDQKPSLAKISGWVSQEDYIIYLLNYYTYKSIFFILTQ